MSAKSFHPIPQVSNLASLQFFLLAAPPPSPPQVLTATLFDLPVLLQQLNLLLVIVKRNLAAACNMRLVQSTHMLASLTSSGSIAPLWRLTDCQMAYLAENCTTLWLKILMALAAPHGLKETLPPPP